MWIQVCCVRDSEVTVLISSRAKNYRSIYDELFPADFCQEFKHFLGWVIRHLCLPLQNETGIME